MDRAVPGTSFGHISALDGVRGIAVMLVLLHHSNLLTDGAGGSVGVSLFFVLSGYLITSLLVAERSRTGSLNLGRFYWRRVIRLLPPFALVVGVSAGSLLVAGDLGEAIRTTAGASSYVSNWIMAQGGEWFGPMSHSWSLAIEEQFYLIWPVVLIALWPVVARWGTPVLVALAVAATVLRPVLDGVGVPPARISFGTDTQADGLLIGCALAFWSAGGRLATWWWLGPVGLAALVSVAWLTPFGMWYLDGGQTAAVLGAGALIIAATGRPDRLTRALLENRWLDYMGKISYSAYLWHYPVMWHAGVIDHKPTVMSLATIAISLALAILTHRYVEQPMLRWRDRRSAAQSIPSPGVQ